jgi:hypothetical protein
MRVFLFNNQIVVGNDSYFLASSTNKTSGVVYDMQHKKAK